MTLARSIQFDNSILRFDSDSIPIEDSNFAIERLNILKKFYIFARLDL